MSPSIYSCVDGCVEKHLICVSQQYIEWTTGWEQQNILLKYENHTLNSQFANFHHLSFTFYTILPIHNCFLFTFIFFAIPSYQPSDFRISAYDWCCIVLMSTGISVQTGKENLFCKTFFIVFAFITNIICKISLSCPSRHYLQQMCGTAYTLMS